MHGTAVSTVNAFTAHREWATRPPDERFNSVQALYEAARTRRIGTEERDVETVAFGTEAIAEDIIALAEPISTSFSVRWSSRSCASSIARADTYRVWASARGGL